MRKLSNILFVFFSVFFVVYLLLPSPEFPTPLGDAAQSVEPADSETSDRRAYFTNTSREAALDHYQNKFKLSVFGLNIPSYKLNYPPEEAYTIIRDQTRSTHLKEIVYPFRESLFVNEFVAKQAKDDIWYKGIHYQSKITVHVKRSNVYVRLVVGLVTLSLTYLIVGEAYAAVGRFVKVLPKIKYIFIK
ncbi:hypothetical protein IPM62_04380 [Candidatus Woesebacteria bacterium]|nr:MAG: hypothetical protein IPM62_04380 [Candidatus Woesebacteria bacterium]